MKLLIAVLTGLLIIACPSGTTAADKAKVLFVGKQPDHPFGTHMYLHTSRMLAKCLKNHGVESVVSDGWPKDPSKLKGVKTIVVYTTPAAEFLLDSPHRDQVLGMLRKGVGLVTIHWASSVFQKNLDRLGPTWLDFMGGTWVSNVGLHTGESQLEQLQPKHPISRGWKPYKIHDEYYLNPTITEATPLLRVTAKDKPVVVGWAYERPAGGRSFGTTLGHYYRNFQQEPFRRIVVNSILWTANVEVPKDGANVTLPEADLALPPKPVKK